MAKVLLLDEEMTIVQMVGELLRSDGHQVIPFTNGQGALDRLAGVAPELIIANAGAERTWSAVLSLLQKSRALQPQSLLILITGPQSNASPVEAIRRGAYDYLTKPFTLHELRLRVQRALAYQATLSENAVLRKQLQSKVQFKELIGASGRLQEALRVVERSADSDSCILIYGPTGTGKELIARAVHFKSARRLAPFVAVHCGELSESRLEAELFGEEPSSSADEQPGLLREADGGTLYLKEINALPLALQTKLLDSLTHRRIEIVRDAAPAHFDVRVLAAAQSSLERQVESGTFLRDLFQRLSTVAVTLPPLRERTEDIPLLIAHFLEGKVHRGTGKPFIIPADVVELCCNYPWPGNVRELEQALEQACTVSQDGSIHVSCLPRALQQLKAPVARNAMIDPRDLLMERAESTARIKFADPKGFTDCQTTELAADLVPLKQFLRNQELGYLQRTLAHVGGSKERAAEVLGISLATMYRKLSEPVDAGAES